MLIRYFTFIFFCITVVHQTCDYWELSQNRTFALVCKAVKRNVWAEMRNVWAETVVHSEQETGSKGTRSLLRLQASYTATSSELEDLDYRNANVQMPLPPHP